MKMCHTTGKVPQQLLALMVREGSTTLSSHQVEGLINDE
jgi:hypothetical protein